MNATGTDRDERFSIRVNTGPSETYTAGTALVRAGLEAGTYTVDISGISSNCTLQGSDAVQVSVPAGERVRATFNIACEMRWLVVTKSAYDATGARLFRMNRDGTGVVPLSSNPGSDYHPSISPDGTRIAFTSTRDGNGEIYVMNADGSNPVRLTSLPTHDVSPTWSPDGTRIAFLTESYPDPSAVRVMNADGTGLTTVASGVTGAYVPLRWSPDGTRLALTIRQDDIVGSHIHTLTLSTPTLGRVTPGGAQYMGPGWLEDGRLTYSIHGGTILAGVGAIDVNGSNPTLLFDAVEHVESHPSVSLDGKWVTYAAMSPGIYSMELYVASLAGGVPVRISGGAHHEFPVWQP